ncbi:MAG: aminopeptidase P family protein [Candidatus Korarchaeota archaeon]|nr:aminopeptidase P family protein [Candidatus Korarchaeota archaeon]NIU83201.1 M24 family metallopeptidase [Candidatus Thorarchaeota archaeon]NIW13563.1 M24 family metallopeptidase [Candidatus Thorarchaeota archaeon]NIW51674.1 M24 family metallopeptidase [Candidatus Korarchaeota archaeon]
MNVYSKRIGKCKAKLKKEHFDGAIIIPGPNFQYLTSYTVESFERFMGLFLPVNEAPLLLLPKLEEERGRTRSVVDRITAYDDSDDLKDVLSFTFSELDLQGGKIGVEGQMPFSTCQLLENASNIEVGNIDFILQSLRLTKSTTEIERIKRSSRILERGISAGFEAITKGITEKEVARVIKHTIEDQGGEVPFLSVQFGPNSAIPHHTYGEREVKKGDVVLIDMGCRYKGYFSDITRVGVVGKINEKIKKIHDVVSKAQERAIERVKPKVEAQEIDSKAREYIKQNGFEDRFIHRTGHGLGLEVHEPPYIKQGNSRRLKPGMVFTVEPGVYLPGDFGIRLENDIVVTSEGFENLTTIGKEIRNI